MLGQVTPESVLNVSQLGMAGLMGALWWWERKYSRTREDQLTEAHQAIMSQRDHLQALLDALQKNSAAISAFSAVQQQLVTLLENHLKG